MILKKLRKAAGLTQRELAEKAGVNIRLIQKYESGETKIENMTLGNAVTLARLLNIHPEELLAQEVSDNES